MQRKRFFLWILLSLMAFAVLLPTFAAATEVLWGLREGSSLSRWELYRYSMQQLQGVDWILGLGLKPREDTFYFPIGSHSTYLSLLFKTGVIGFLAFLMFQGGLLLRWYSLKNIVMKQRTQFLFWRGMGWILLGMAIWMLTEDIDAPQLLAFLYFSCIGVFEGFRRSVLA